MEFLIKYLKMKMLKKFTGKIEINFFEGGIGNINEHKRRQAAPVLRVSKKAFGIGRRIPIVNHFHE